MMWGEEGMVKTTEICHFIMSQRNHFPGQLIRKKGPVNMVDN